MTLANTTFKAKRSAVVHRKGFWKAFESLPHKEMRPVKDELREQLGWSISNFQYKKRGESPIREDEAVLIESIFAGFGLDAWTGEKI